MLRRLLLTSLTLLLLPLISYPQGGNTTVTGTILDPNNSVYTNSQVNITFVEPTTPGKIPLLNGSTFQKSFTIFSTDSFGHFSISLPDTGIIDSSSGTSLSQWSFRVIYSDRVTSFVYVTPINCSANIPVTCNSGTMDISIPLKAAAALLPAQGGGGGSFILKSPPCSSTESYIMGGIAPTTQNTAFKVNLTCNVTSSSITQSGGGPIQVGAVAQFTLIQDSIGGRAHVWPANFIDQPPIQAAANATTNSSFWFDGTSWHAQTFPASGGGGGGNPAGASGDLQTNNGIGAFGASHINDTGSTLIATLPFTLPGGTLNGTYLGSPIFSLTGNEEIKPKSSDSVMYVSVNGNDSNDGFSWGTAKLTIFGAIVALPGGNPVGPIAGSGTIYVSSGAKAHPTTGVGIWIMGSGDPNYASPPAGWIKYSSGSIELIGVGATTAGILVGDVPRVPITGGSTADRNHPSLWLSGGQGFFIPRNIVFSGSQRPIVLGECSNNSRSTTACQVFGFTLDNNKAITSRINSASGPTFDSPNSTSVSIRNSTLVGVAGSVTPLVDNEANILQGTATNQAGSMSVENTQLFYGGIKVLGNSQGSLFTHNVDEYGDFTNPMPPVIWYTNWGTLSAGSHWNTTRQDPAAVQSIIRVDTTCPFCPGPTVIGGFETNSIQGPATILLNSPYYSQQAVNQTITSGKNGIINNYLFGESNIARRISGFVPVRFTNQAFGTPSLYTSAGNTITLAQTDPFGGTGAVKVHTALAGGQNLLLSSSIAYTPATGDWIVGGFWVRQQTPFVNANVQAGVLSTGTATIGLTKSQGGPDQGDGEWQWNYIAKKVTANSAATNVQLIAQFNSSNDLFIYGPILDIIPAAQITDDEALWFVQSMNTHDPACLVGTICNTPGHNMQMAGGTEIEFLNGTHFVGLKAPASLGSNFVWSLPNADSVGTQCLSSNGSQQFSFSACSGGTGTPGGANTQIQFNNAGSFGGSTNLTWVSPALSIGTPAGATGQLKYVGTSSGTVTTQSQDAAGTWTFKWPATAGTSGFPMVTDGTGVGAWSLLGLAGGGTNSGSAAFTNTQLVGVSGGSLASLAGTLTGTNPVLTLTSALTTSVPFALNTPASPTADLFDLNINSVKTSWFDNLAILHTPSATFVGSGALVLSGTEGTCPVAAAGTDILCVGNLGTHTIQSSLNGTTFKDIPQWANSGPTAHGVVVTAVAFPQTNSTSAGALGQAFLSQGASADPIFGTLGAVGGGLGTVSQTAHGVLVGEGTSPVVAVGPNATANLPLLNQVASDPIYGPLPLGATTVSGQLPIANGGTGASTLAAANIAVFTGAITPNNCVKWSSATVITDSGGTCGGAGGAARLDQITAATASNTINSTIQPQIWNWALTGSTTAFKFGENTAATGSSNILLQASTLSTSTAIPFQADSNGIGWNLSTTGLWQPKSTGTLVTPGTAHGVVVSEGNSTANVTVGPGTTGQFLRATTSGDPTYSDFPDYHYYPAADCVNTVGASGWSTAATPTATCRAGTNNKEAYLLWGASDTAQMSIGLPADWDTSNNPSIRLRLASTDATNGHTIIMQIATACSKGDGSVTDDVAFNTAQSLSTITLNGNANRQWDATLSNITMTGCIAGGILRLQLSRTTDTATNVDIYGLGITIPRLLTLQAN